MSAGAPPRSTQPPADADFLAGLNDEQRAAVTYGTGPLLVLAGAGTGKTSVLTRRIAWLIATRRARPEQILALTFTDKAAIEMESRVDVLVPFGLVGATIATFNAFCDRLVREHAIELGLTSRLRVESQAEILVFLRDRLFELGLDRYLPAGNPEAHLAALHGIFDRARNEDVTPEQYVACAEKLMAEAGDDPAKRDYAEGQLEVARAYGRYLELLFAAGRVDFGSQIALALRLLRERPYLQREYQERFPWILVDEFQDTNHAQFELIRLLAGTKHNVTVVGDDDQSIYRWRGARVENLLDFLETFPGAREVLLVRNYRSGQTILDRAHRLIRHNDPARLEVQRGVDKRLVADRVDADGAPFQGAVEHRAFLAARDQSDTVAAEIAQAIAAGRRAGEFAILARAHNHLDPFAQSLQAVGVRFVRVGMRGLYTRPEVQLCLNALRAVADPDRGSAVYVVLGDPLFGADPVDLARLGAKARDTHRGLLRVAVDAAARDSTLAEETREAIRRFADLHRELARLATSRPSHEVLYAFVHGSGLLDALVQDGLRGEERMQNLNKLFGITTRIGRLLSRDLVNTFIPHLDLLIEMGDDPASAEAETDEESVSLLTAHGAKGLEFPVVYLVDLTMQRFPQNRKADPLPFPKELRHSKGDDALEQDREERRLFYVAMTRARDRLVLCHARDLGGKRLAKTSKFVLEALDLPEPPKGARGAGALESIERFAPVPGAPAGGPAPLAEDQVLNLSHSQIHAYGECPLRYRYAYIAHVPLPPNPRRMYGAAIHHAIQVWHKHRMRGLPIEATDMIAAYENEWSSEGFLTLAHEERMKAQGRELLERFVRNDLAAKGLPLAIEREFRVRLGSNHLIGRWDRIDERAGGIALVDYKTSEVHDAARADERARESARHGQLGLYALAYLETYERRPKLVELSFLGSGMAGTVVVEDEHVENARERILETAAGIRAAHFEPRPDPRTCGHCDYRDICPASVAKRTE